MPEVSSHHQCTLFNSLLQLRTIVICLDHVWFVILLMAFLPVLADVQRKPCSVKSSDLLLS